MLLGDITHTRLYYYTAKCRSCYNEAVLKSRSMNNTVVTAQFQSMKFYLKMVMITDLVKACLFAPAACCCSRSPQCSCIPVWSTTAGSCTHTAFTTADIYVHFDTAMHPVNANLWQSSS